MGRVGGKLVLGLSLFSAACSDDVGMPGGATGSGVASPDGTGGEGATSGGTDGTSGSTTQTASGQGGDGVAATGGAGAEDTGPYLAPEGAAARLSQYELDSALRDILGDDQRPAATFLSEDEFSPFDNDASRQTVSSALIDSLAVLADDVAARAVEAARAGAEWMPCEPAGADDEACFDNVTRSLGRLFFRRSLSDDELPAYRSLMEYGVEQGDFYVSMSLLLQSFIQDPEFLYRVERGSASDVAGALDLSGTEIATRMAILLLGTTPGDSLLLAGEAGDLADGAARRSVAESLLDDARARAQLYRFHAMWLGYRALPHDAALNAEFQAETERLIERVVFTDRSGYLDLFSSAETYLTASLATHYGLPSPDGGEGWVPYPGDSGRAGILGHASVLSAFSKFSDTSPTQRGIFVRTRLMCLDVPPPPPTIDVDQPPEEVEGGCKLDRYRAHREQPGCVECHDLFDPIGVGLENYDLAGRYRETDDGDPSCEITEAGSLPGYGDFRGPAELASLLLDNDLIAACFSRYFLQFAWGKGSLGAGERGFADERGAALEASGAPLDEWLLDLVEHESFGMRVAPPQSEEGQ